MCVAHLEGHKKKTVCQTVLVVIDLGIVDLLFQIEYNTQIATRPTKPCAPRAAIIVVTLVITLVAGINGIAAPLKRISTTIASAMILTPTSARPPAHAFTFCNISITILLYCFLDSKFI